MKSMDLVDISAVVSWSPVSSLTLYCVILNVMFNATSGNCCRSDRVISVDTQNRTAA